MKFFSCSCRYSTKCWNGMFKHYGDTSKQQYSVLQNVVWMEKPGEDRGESILMCQVNSRLLGFLNFFFFFFQTQAGWQWRGERKWFPFWCLQLPPNELLAVDSHLTKLAKVNDAELCSFQIFIATGGKYYMKERRRTEVTIQLPWLDVQGGENRSKSQQKSV